MNQPIIYCDVNYKEKSPGGKAAGYKKSNTMTSSPAKNIGCNNPTNQSAGDEDNFSVYVRIRPLNNREIALSNGKKRSKIIKKQDNMVKIQFNEFFLSFPISLLIQTGIYFGPGWSHWRLQERKKLCFFRSL